MESSWNPTERLVADRRNAFEAAARRQRLVAGTRPARRLTLRRRSTVSHSTTTAACTDTLRLA